MSEFNDQNQTLEDTPRFNQELFSTFQNMAEEVDSLASKEEVLIHTSRSRVTVNSFNAFRTVPNATNYCGQAACASIIKAWGHHHGKSDEDLAKDIYTKFPPDIFGGACGTSPGRVVQILKAYGFKATYAQVAAWLPGGFLNPVNQIAWQHHRNHVIDKWVKAGYPVITLVDAGAIGGPWFQPHWVPLASASDSNATICNAFGNGYSNLTMNIDRFHEAWEVRFLPGLNFVSLLPQPI